MLDTLLLIMGGLLALSAITLFVNALTGKKLLSGKEGIVFDVSKYALILLLILISINMGSTIGIVLFSLAGVGVWFLGNKFQK
jgi:hypothetical protein